VIQVHQVDTLHLPVTRDDWYVGMHERVWPQLRNIEKKPVSRRVDRNISIADNGRADHLLDILPSTHTCLV
jgi:hypothetical protein